MVRWMSREDREVKREMQSTCLVREKRGRKETSGGVSHLPESTKLHSFTSEKAEECNFLLILKSRKLYFVICNN